MFGNKLVAIGRFIAKVLTWQQRRRKEFLLRKALWSFLKLLLLGTAITSTRNYHSFIGSNRRFIEAFCVQQMVPIK